MKKSILFGLSTVALVLLSVVPAAAVTLYDGLAGPLDTAKWVVNSGAPAFAAGVMTLNNDSISSKAPDYQFSPPAFALARVSLDATASGFGDNQRFGFNLASLTAGPGKVGAFFSTVGAGDLNAYVFNNGVLVWSATVIPKAEASEDYHILKIAWLGANRVEFYVDGEVKATYTGGTGIPGPATVDFSSGPVDMLVDWVLATNQYVSLDYTTLGNIGTALGLTSLCGTVNNTVNPDAKVTEFGESGGAFFTEETFTSNVGSQTIAVLFLNERAEDVDFAPQAFNIPNFTGSHHYGYSSPYANGKFGGTSIFSWQDNGDFAGLVAAHSGIIGCLTVDPGYLKYKGNQQNSTYGVETIHGRLYFREDGSDDNYDTAGININVEKRP